MAVISKVVVVQGDRRAGQAIRLGFEREGAEVVLTGTADDGARALASGAGLVVAGAASPDEAAQLLRRLREAKTASGSDAPLLYVGNGASRREALDAGADEVLPPPAYVRDVVTVGKLLAGSRNARAHMQGDLGDTFGVFYLVRALVAIGRSAVLSLVRGLRRGEVRFFEGEVTSAAVGGLHGQAALHQLLLWTEARYELRWEDVVRRGQIPLDRDALLRDAERFLTDLRDVSGGLSPAAVYEQDPQRLGAMAKQIPTEVHGVLRLFDGQRTIADVIEDCPFRVFETLRVSQRAAEVGLIRRVRTPRPRSASRATLAVEEWLVGVEEKGPALAGATIDSAPSQAPVPASKKGNKKAKKRNRTLHGVASGPTPAPRPAPVEIDWGPLVPRSVGVELIGLSGVVPAAKAAGEIVVGEIRARKPTAPPIDSGRVPRAQSPTVQVEGASERRTVKDRAMTPVGGTAAEAALAEGVPTAAPDAPTLKVPDPTPVAVPTDETPTVPTDVGVAPEVVAAPISEPIPSPIPPTDGEPSGDFDEPTPQVPIQPVLIEAMRRSRAPSPRDTAEASGELPARRSGELRAAAPPDRPVDRPVDEGPSILVEDLATAHAAMSVVADRLAASVDDEDLETPASGSVAVAASAVRPAPVARPQAQAPTKADRQQGKAGKKDKGKGKPQPATKPTPETQPTGGRPLKDSRPPPHATGNGAAAEVEATRSAAVAAALAAIHFTEDEQAFFTAGDSPTFGHPEAHDSFEDLDAGYRPTGFWERLMAWLMPRRARESRHAQHHHRR